MERGGYLGFVDQKSGQWGEKADTSSRSSERPCFKGTRQTAIEEGD